jgi:hypothetical protein
LRGSVRRQQIRTFLRIVLRLDFFLQIQVGKLQFAELRFSSPPFIHFAENDGKEISTAHLSLRERCFYWKLLAIGTDCCQAFQEHVPPGGALLGEGPNVIGESAAKHPREERSKWPTDHPGSGAAESFLRGGID